MAAVQLAQKSRDGTGASSGSSDKPGDGALDQQSAMVRELVESASLTLDEPLIEAGVSEDARRFVERMASTAGF